MLMNMSLLTTVALISSSPRSAVWLIHDVTCGGIRPAVLFAFLCAWMLRFNFQVEPRSLCARRRVCVTLASCWRGIGHTGS